MKNPNNRYALVFFHTGDKNLNGSVLEFTNTLKDAKRRLFDEVRTYRHAGYPVKKDRNIQYRYEVTIPGGFIALYLSDIR